MPNTQQRLFILTSNRRIRKGLLLIPELPGSLEDDAYEWIIVARSSALCSWSPPTLLYFVGCAGCASGAGRGVRGASGSDERSSEVGSLQSLCWPRRQPLVSVHSLARLETVTSGWSKAHPKILRLTDYFLKCFGTKSIPICGFF